MDPVYGRNVQIELKKNDEFWPYACATDVDIQFDMETKSVKTIGDGNWQKLRGQSKKYRVNLSGLIKYDDDTVPHVFDLYQYYDNMVSIEARLRFTVAESGQEKTFTGLVLPVSLNIGGGSEGFGTGSAVLEGDGAPVLSDGVSSCTAEITAATLVLVSGENALRVTALNGGPVTRYEYAFDGDLENRTTAFVDGTLPDDILFGNAPGGGVGDHTLTVWPICEDGNDGEPFEIEFTNLP